MPGVRVPRSARSYLQDRLRDEEFVKRIERRSNGPEGIASIFSRTFKEPSFEVLGDAIISERRNLRWRGLLSRREEEMMRRGRKASLLCKRARWTSTVVADLDREKPKLESRLEGMEGEGCPEVGEWRHSPAVHVELRQRDGAGSSERLCGLRREVRSWPKVNRRPGFFQGLLQ